MTARTEVSRVLTTFVVTVGLAAGSLLAYAALPSPPTGLAPASRPATFEVVTSAFADPRTMPLEMDMAPSVKLHSAASG